MSVAEIQDNKWELQVTKAPVSNPAAIGMILMMFGFSLFFVFMIVGSVIGSFTETETMNFDKKETKAAAE
jgi:ABC-type Na+ efflux pump permease subunit